MHAGVKSTALLFGNRTKPILSGFSVAFVGLLAYSGLTNGLHWPFLLVSVSGAASHLWRQLAIVDLDSRESCWATFRSNRDLGVFVWAGIALDYVLYSLQ